MQGKEHNNIPIDGRKLHMAIWMRGLSDSQIALEMHYSKSWVAKCRERGKISEELKEHLEKEYGIPYEEYKGDAPEEKSVLNFVPIDGAKLKESIKTRELSICRIAAEMGYGKSYLCSRCKEGTLNPAAIEFIDKRYGIKYDEYKRSFEA